MWTALVVPFCVYLWALNTVQCSDEKCSPVAMFEDVHLDCAQKTYSTERFILWYYSNDSKTGFENAASCYFNRSCNVTDQRQYVLEDMSQNNLAKTRLTIKNVSASQNGWRYQCFVWDAEEDAMYASEKYRLLVYKAPRKEMNCSYKESERADVNVKCEVEGVFPQNITCLVQCQNGKHLILDARVRSMETQHDVTCEGSIPITSKSYWSCNVTVLARDDVGSCEYVLATKSDSFAYPGNSTPAVWNEGSKVAQEGSNTNVYFSYIFSGVVAALVIPLSIYTLCMVLRKRRQRSIPSVQFPIYTQVSTSQELSSAQSTNCSWESSWEGSGRSSLGEVASGVYNNTASMCEVEKSRQNLDAPGSTLPFIVVGGDIVDNVTSGEFSDFVTLPTPHRPQQTFTETDNNDVCNRPSLTNNENVRFEKRRLNESPCNCHKPRSRTKFIERKCPYGIGEDGSEYEHTELKQLYGAINVCDSCKYNDSIIPNSRTSGCCRRKGNNVYKSDQDDVSDGCNQRHFCDVRDESTVSLACSGIGHRRLNSGLDEGACSPQVEQVCNRNFGGNRCDAPVACRCSRRSDQCTEFQDRQLYHRQPDSEHRQLYHRQPDSEHRQLYHRQPDSEHRQLYHRQPDSEHRHDWNEEAGRGRRNEHTRHQGTSDKPLLKDDDQCSDHYIDPCSSETSTYFSNGSGSRNGRQQCCDDNEQRTLLENSPAPDVNIL